MTNDTYLMVNGNKIEFTDEQKKQLGVVKEKGCFDRVSYGETYYAIKPSGKVSCYTDVCDDFDASMYSVANYCTDEDLMNQRVLHETLNRLLWRYSMTHHGDKIDWSNITTEKYSIVRTDKGAFLLNSMTRYRGEGSVYFISRDTALRAVDDVIKPFMQEHPEFVW